MLCKSVCIRSKTRIILNVSFPTAENMLLKTTYSSAVIRHTILSLGRESNNYISWLLKMLLSEKNPMISFPYIDLEEQLLHQKLYRLTLHLPWLGTPWQMATKWKKEANTLRSLLHLCSERHISVRKGNCIIAYRNIFNTFRNNVHTTFIGLNNVSSIL